MVLFFLVLSAAAIFVRTDFFRDRLRNQVVEAAQSSLGITIKYKEANVDVFRLYPRLVFSEVSLGNRSADENVEIERVSVSVSLFLSLPLLLFNQIYISKAQVEGVHYDLNRLDLVQSWLERIKPKDGLIPSGFRTIVGEIELSNIGLNVDLVKPRPEIVKMKGKVFLNQFSLELDGDGYAFDGNLNYSDLEINALKIPDGSLRIDESQFYDGEIELGELLLDVRGDEIKLSGLIRSLDKPEIDLRGSFHVALEKYEFLKEASGKIESDFRISGPLKNLKGEGSFYSDQLMYGDKGFRALETDWRLENALFQISGLDWKESTGSGTLSGQIDLTPQKRSKLRLDLNEIQLGSYLKFVNPDLRLWKATVSGKALIDGDILYDQDINVATDISFQEFEINHARTRDLILKIQEGKIITKTSFQGFLSADTSIRLSTPVSEWGGGMRWDQESFMIEWDSVIRNGVFGQLFDFEMAIDGTLRGYYGGPFKKMVMKATPNFRSLRLNEMSLEHVSGELQFVDRHLIAAPILAKGAEVSGGLYFPPKPDRKTYFSDFTFQFSQMDIRRALNSLPASNAWRVKPFGKGSGSGTLNGWIAQPKGTGNLVGNDVRFGTDPTLGRVAKANFEFNNGRLFFNDVFVQTSKDGGGVNGSLSVRITGIEDFALQAKKVRLSDWALVAGLELPFQSMLDFDMNYRDDIEEFNAKIRFYETMVGGRVQEQSFLTMNATDRYVDAKLEIFKKKVVLNLKSTSTKEGVGEIVVNEFDIAPLSKELQKSGIQFDLNGSGKCQVRWAFSDRQDVKAYLRYFAPPEKLTCETSFKESEVKRANAVLHEIDAFNLDLQKLQKGSFRLSTPELLVRTGQDKLSFSGWYESVRKLDMNVAGATSLESLSYLLPFLNRSEGRVQVDGNWNKTGFSGGVKLNDGMLLFEDSPFVMRNVRASMNATDSNFELSQLVGDLQEGSLNVSGNFHLEGFQVDSALLAVQLNGSLFEPQNGARFRVSGPLRLSIVETEATVSGQVSLYEASFQRRINLRGDLLKSFQKSGSQYSFFEKEQSYLDTWRLDVKVSSREPVVIRNNVADGSLDLNLRVIGTIGSPRLDGSVGVVRGSFNYFNRNFDITSGSLQFTGTEKNLPRYDLRAETEIDEYRVFITFQGSENEQKIIYSSDPPLTEKQILALVSYGTPPTNEDTVIEDDVTVSAAYTGLSFFTGSLQDTIEGALSTDLGIRRFTLYPAFYEETGRTELQLTVGTDIIRNRLLLNYSNFVSTSGGHQVELDFRLNRSVSLVGSWRDTDENVNDSFSGDLGGDIVFRFEFE